MPRREKIDMAVFAAAPGFVRVSLRLRGAGPLIDASRTAAALALLDRASAKARSRSEGAEGAAPGHFHGDPDGAAWRDTYWRAGLPDDTVAPHVALAAWAATPGGVPTQGPLLDVLHALSLDRGVPVAADDLAGVTGDVWLRPSRGIELHEPIAGGPPSSPAIGEIVLVDSADVVMARDWHGSAGRRAAVRGVPDNVLVHVDLLAPTASDVDAAADAVRRLLDTHVGGDVAVDVLRREEPVATWLE
ncbi:MAG: hypothetical protein ACK2T6_05845 [Anaerolineae bacterium]